MSMTLDAEHEKVKNLMKANKKTEEEELEFIKQIDEALKSTQDKKNIRRLETQKRIAYNRVDIVRLMQSYQTSTLAITSGLSIIAKTVDKIVEQVKKSATKEELDEIREMQKQMKNIKKYSLIVGDLNIGVTGVKVTGTELG